MEFASSGGIKEHGSIPPVGGSAPTCLPPPPSEEKRPKSAIFCKFFIFFPLRIAFCPSMPPAHRKFLVPSQCLQEPILAPEFLKFRFLEALLALGDSPPPRGDWPRKGVWGCAALKTPFSGLRLLPLARVPFQAKESVHKTPFWEHLEI